MAVSYSFSCYSIVTSSSLDPEVLTTIQRGHIGLGALCVFALVLLATDAEKLELKYAKN